MRTESIMPGAPFDPADATTVIAPPCGERGCWAGAPSAAVADGSVLLSYRLRGPGVRGFATHLAESGDGRSFVERWSATKDQFDAESIERSAIVPVAGGVRLYVSYAARSDRHWRIALLEAPSVERLDPARRREILTAADTGTAAVKDPVVLRRGGRWWMLASVTSPGVERGELHVQGDAFNSGLVSSFTGLASSDDGVAWRWEGIVFSPRAGAWDGWESRIATVLPEGDGFVALYDGAAGVEGNYEERTGIATSRDLRSWRRLTADGPALQSAVGTHALRYASALEHGGRTFFYHEAARADGAHELRVAVR